MPCKSALPAARRDESTAEALIGNLRQPGRKSHQAALRTATLHPHHIGVVHHPVQLHAHVCQAEGVHRARYVPMLSHRQVGREQLPVLLVGAQVSHAAVAAAQLAVVQVGYAVVGTGGVSQATLNSPFGKAIANSVG